MPRRSRLIGFECAVAVVVGLVLSGPAAAQRPSGDEPPGGEGEAAELPTADDAAEASNSEDPLAKAEKAHLEIDFPTVLKQIEKALRSGAYGPKDVARAYELRGLAAGALGKHDMARDSFVRMLALDPEREVDRRLSPRLRNPFMEARGFWIAINDRLGTQVRARRRQGVLVVEKTDPVDMVAAIRLHARVADLGEFQTFEYDADDVIEVELEGLSDKGWAQVAVELLDEHGNRLVELGSMADPQEVGEPVAPGGGGPGGGVEESPSIFTSPWFWVATAVAVGGGIGVYFYLDSRDQPLRGQTVVSF